MSIKDLKETTQVRIIKSEAKTAILEEREAILGGVKEMTDGIKSEMHTYFATKNDLLDWRLCNYKEQEIRIKEAIKLHVHQDHKPMLTHGRVSLIPRGRLSNGQKGAIIGAIVTVLTAIATAIKYFFS